MSKKLVVITGSPRKNGNSFAMTQSFIDEAKKQGHIVTRFDAAFMNVDGCQACDTCYESEKACSFDDDFNTIANSIVDADAVIFTMPVYWYTMPGKIKNVIDKLYSLYVSDKDIEEKESALISCCEEDDMSVFDGVSIPYERTIALLKWKNIGEILIPGVYNIGDINKTNGCQLAAKLANKF